MHLMYGVILSFYTSLRKPNHYVDEELNGVDFTVPMNGKIGTPIMMTGLECNGTENGLFECPHSSFISQCSHTSDAGARCSKNKI